MTVAGGSSSTPPSLPLPSPKSPPGYPDLYGKRREMAKVLMLEREIGFLQEELKSMDGLQPSSRCCKEVADFVLANADPLISINRKKRRSCRFWEWLCKRFCFNFSWTCCCQCSRNCKMPRCCCNCKMCDCKMCNCNICDCNICDCNICDCNCSLCTCCSFLKWRRCCWPGSCEKNSCCRRCCILRCPKCPDCLCTGWRCSWPKCPDLCCCCKCTRKCCNSCCSCY